MGIFSFFSNEEEDDKKDPLFSHFTGGGKDAFTQAGIAQADREIAEEGKKQMDDRVQFIRDVHPDYIGSKIDAPFGPQQPSAFGPQQTEVTEGALRNELETGGYEIELTEEEKTRWETAKDKTRQEEIRQSGDLLSKIGQKARDTGEDLGMRVGDWGRDFSTRAETFVSDPLGQISKTLGGFNDIIQDAGRNFEDDPEQQEIRANGGISRPKAVNETDEEYAANYYFYENLLKESDEIYRKADEAIKNIESGGFAGRMVRNAKGEDVRAENLSFLRTQKDNAERTRFSVEKYLGVGSVNRNILGPGSLVSQKDLLEFIPGVQHGKLAADMVSAQTTFDKYERGEELNDFEQSIVNKYIAYALDTRINYGLGSQVGLMLSELPAFAIEFGVSGGVATAAKSGLAKIAIKKGTDSVVKSVGKGILRNGITKMVAGGAAQTAVGFTPRITTNTMQYMMPHYDVVATEEGERAIKRLDDGDDFTKAFAKGFTTTYIEVFTEQLGSLVDKPLNALKGGIMSKFAGSLAKEVPSGVVTTSMFTKALKATGWNGVIGEVLEEEIGEFLTAPVEGREYKDPLSTAEGRERFLTEFLGIAAYGSFASIPNATFSATNQIVKKYEKAGTPTTVEMDMVQESLGWRKEFRDTVDDLGAEEQQAVEEDIRQVQQQLDDYQDGSLIDTTAIPEEVKGLLLKGTLPTLERRIGPASMKRIAKEAGLMPLTADGEVDVARMEAEDGVAPEVQVDAKGVPIVPGEPGVTPGEPAVGPPARAVAGQVAAEAVTPAPAEIEGEAPPIQGKEEFGAPDLSKFSQEAQDFVGTKISDAGRIRIAEVESVFDLIPERTVSPDGFVEKRGGQMFPTSKATPEVLQNSGIELNADGSIKSGFGYNKITFTEDVMTPSKIAEEFSKQQDLPITQKQDGKTIQGQQGEQLTQPDQAAPEGDQKADIWQSARAQKEVLKTSLSQEEIEVVDLVTERQGEAFAEHAFETISALDSAMAGARVFTPSPEIGVDFDISRQKSTFPSWFPLRTKTQINEFLDKLPEDPAQWTSENNPFKEGTAKAEAWDSFVKEVGTPSDFGGINLLEADRADIESSVGSTLEDLETKVGEAAITPTKVEKPPAKPIAPAERTAPPRRFGPKAKLRTSTRKGREAAALKPVESRGKIKKSKAYSRIVERLGESARDDVKFNQLNLAEDAAKAIEFTQANPLVAERIAKGLELAPEGITDTAISLAMSEQAFAEGNNQLASDLEASRSLRQTRRGQEISAERGRLDDNSPQHFIDQVIATRMELANKGGIFYKVGKEKRTATKKARATQRISEETKKVKEALSPTEVKLKRAQDVIDSLTCAI